MKAVIVEDEHVAAQTLQRLIAEISPDTEIVASLQSVEESVEWFSLNPMPDLVFMDIHLADGSSFAIFEKIAINCPIIFTTAYNEYALKAFEVNSIDYLLKPITKKDLERAIEKHRKLTSTKVNNEDFIANIIAMMQQPKEIYKSHFLIPYKDKLLPLSVNDIAYVYTENKMARIVTFNQETYFLDTSLEEIMVQLDPVKFFRANRQFIISHKSIKDISMWFGYKLSVNLTTPTPEKIIVSKARVPDFKKWYTR